MLCAPTLDETRLDMSLAGRPAQATACRSWPLASMLRTFGDAFREALAAQRRYDRLRSRNISHDTALRQALGISNLGK